MSVFEVPWELRHDHRVTEKNRQRARDLAAECMRLRGLTRAKLAERAQVDPKTLRSFLDGGRWPQQDKREAISTALHWPADEIDWIAEHGAPRDILGASLVELAAQNPAELDGDDASEWMTSRRLRDEHGNPFYEVTSQRADPQASDLTTRVVVRYWSSAESVVSTDLMVVVARAHRELDDLVADHSARTGGGGDAEESRGPAPIDVAFSPDVSDADDELPAAAKGGAIEEPGEFTT